MTNLLKVCISKCLYYKKYFFNKAKWNLLKNAWCGYPFDYAYFYRLQLAKLNEMLQYFKTSELTDRKDDIVKSIQLAINLLSVYVDDKNDTYPDGISKYDFQNKTLTVIPYLNKRNIERFANGQQHLEKWPDDELYKLKAISIYHRLCLYKASTEWWD